MCDLSKKLVAWMDGELPENESAAVARHIESCLECRECLAAFEQSSEAFNKYCEMAAEQAETPFGVSVSRQRVRHAKSSRWMPVACGIGAIAAAAVVAMLIMQPRRQIVQAPPNVAAQSAPAHVAEKSDRVEARNNVALPIVAERHNRMRSPAETTRAAESIAHRQRPRVAEPQGGDAIAAQSPIEISVPAEDMFPPGAVPDGISYTAVVTFAADGSLPRHGNGMKTRFNRGGNRP